MHILIILRFRFKPNDVTKISLPDCSRVSPLLISVGYITETSPYSFGYFRKLSLCNCFMPM